MLFVIFINDLEEGAEGWVSKFADVIKIGGVMDEVEGCCRPQRAGPKNDRWSLTLISAR